MCRDFETNTAEKSTSEQVHMVRKVLGWLQIYLALGKES